MQKTVYGRRTAIMRRWFPDLLLLQVRAFPSTPQPLRSGTFMLAMKLTIVFLTAAFLQVHANAVSQNVTITGKDMTLKKLFSVIEQQTGYVVLSNKKDLEATKPVTLSVFDIPLQHLLNMILKDQPVNFRLDGTTIVLSRKPATNLLPGISIYQQGIPVEGNVTDSAGNPVQGASVKLSPGDKGTTTNSAGNFSIPNITAGNYTLEVSFVGYEVHRQRISVPSAGAVQLGKITLRRANTSMESIEIVATGYQTLPRDRATGSFSTVTSELLSTRVEPNVLTRIEGLIPGLFSKSTGGFNIRGLATLYGDRQPLIVVDGFPFEGDINYLNPDDILNVTVLKDAAAASIYGTRSANGVIVITTRLGSARQTRINVNSTVYITPKPDIGYLNLLNSSEMVDFQKDIWTRFHQSEPYGYAVPKVLEAMYAFERGDITQTELDAILNQLKSNNGTAQVQDMLVQSKISHKHSVSVTGGNDKHQYSLNMNYIGDRGYTIKTNSEAINLGLNNKSQVFKWLTAEAGIFSNFSKNKYSNINATDLYRYMPYEVLKDADGNYVPWNNLKSPAEIARLNAEGLLDESYNPLQQLDYSDIRSNSQYLRVQGGLNIRFSKALNLEVKYQTERGSNYYKSYNTIDSWRTANMINNATQIKNGEIVKNIPDGGQISETRGDTRSYTARAQLNFDKRLGRDHAVTAIAGAERRAVVQTSTTIHRLGYNDNNLQFLPVDYNLIADLKATQSVEGNFSYRFNDYNNFGNTELRYVSFYGNAGYNYKGRYNLTGSVRVDESNLWGTDPRYRHLPNWSAGMSWRLSEEDFMKDLYWLNNLNLRATYGTGGNTARNTGPYLQVNSTFFTETGSNATNILYPPNNSLRWEKTETTNFGLDFAVLKNRITGSFDYYVRKTTDLLGEKPTDPTNAFPSAMVNYGSVNNKGFEIGINTVNITDKDFNWSSRITFTRNKNKMTDIAPRSELLQTYLDGNGVQRKGYPMNSIFNFHSAGLDPTNGTPMVYDKDGNVVTNYDQSGNVVTKMTDLAGLVYGGTLDPTYTIGFMNTVTYKRFTFTMMIVANGGNVLRNAIPGAIDNWKTDRNPDRSVLNYWKKPGDEKNPGVMPAPALGNFDPYLTYLWFSTDLNTLKADYVKVRNIGLSYDFVKELSRFTKLSAASLMVQVQNPFSWFRNDKDLDPEAYATNSNGANRTLPVTPVYMVGINVTF